MNPSAKILTQDKLEDELTRVRADGKKIVFTNGCFDILHQGHVRYLSLARSHGNILVIGLNSDESVKLIKGDKRPIVEQRQRAEVLAALRFVDYVTLFDEADPLAIAEDGSAGKRARRVDQQRRHFDIVGPDVAD